MGVSSSRPCYHVLELVFGAPLSASQSILPPVVIGEKSKQLPYQCSSNGKVSAGVAVKKADQWMYLRPAFFSVLIIAVTVMSGFFLDWLGEDDEEGFSWTSVLKFGTIPLVAAIIGYSTNVLALWMMFWPLEFIGCFPQLKLGRPLDFFLCGYQGVIPMKVREMAEISYDMMTTKLVTVAEIFDRLDPNLMHKELHDVMPGIITEVLDEAANKTIPEWWHKTPDLMKKTLEERTTAATESMFEIFVNDLKLNIDEVFDLKNLVVELMVENKRITNDLFFKCGREELEFIKITGFYLGYICGILQMMIWLFVRQWWILPICGVLVGYLTNEFALKVIFIPAEPKPIFGGLYTVQGLFLKRQQEVAPIYAEKVEKEILSVDNMIEELCTGRKSGNLREMCDKHVQDLLQQQIGSFKQLLLWSVGPEDMERFQLAICSEFWGHFRGILTHAKSYMQEAIGLEATLVERMQAMPPKDFERLLHSVFEQDEFKLVLVGAFLGAIVGFLQALVQEPQQLGL
jgi:uncharacterized membrane protein YheB (UPF0754 family)